MMRRWKLKTSVAASAMTCIILDVFGIGTLDPHEDISARPSPSY
jgi:hypothetical protein